MKQTFKPLHPKVVLAVGAHPDDMDFGASGTLARWAAAGANVHYAIVTDGSKGSSDEAMTSPQLIKLRAAEQRAAAKIVGATGVHFLGYEDGTLEISMELKQQLVRLIRQIRPDTVVTMDPSMVYSYELGFINHPDHRAASQATLDAVFPLARDRLSFPGLESEGLKPHKVAHLYMINLDKHNWVEDITDTFETKLAALAAHKSQVPAKSELRDYLESRAIEAGRAGGYRYGEGFIRLTLPA